MPPATALRTGQPHSGQFAGTRLPALWRWLLLLSVTYVAILSVPAPWASYGTGLDPSWILGLNLAHSQGLVAGRDMVFTYGPLGYLLYPEPLGGCPCRR